MQEMNDDDEQVATAWKESPELVVGLGLLCAKTNHCFQATVSLGWHKHLRGCIAVCTCCKCLLRHNSELPHVTVHSWQPLTAGGEVTLKQACFVLIELKQEGHIRDAVFGKLMRILAKVLLPKDNVMPPFLYLVERVMQSHSSDNCLYHACPQNHYIWPH